MIDTVIKNFKETVDLYNRFYVRGQYESRIELANARMHEYQKLTETIFGLARYNAIEIETAKKIADECRDYLRATALEE